MDTIKDIATSLGSFVIVFGLAYLAGVTFEYFVK